MPFSYRKLRGRIVEILGTQSAFADAMGWSLRTTSLKLNNAVTWKQEEIERAVDVLKLTVGDIPLYFFMHEVQELEVSEQ